MQISPNTDDDASATWHSTMKSLMDADPKRFVPVTTAGLDQAVAREDCAGFMDHLRVTTLRNHYPLMGEFFFRHYTSSLQLQKAHNCDVGIPIEY